jgi:putative phosphoserine phosphatase / 1-acylglycerol-3-phosphate O-acyltransferase
MTGVAAQAAEAIRQGPKGPHIGAFYDVDGTIIDGYSARALYTHRFRHFEVGPDEVIRLALAARGEPLDEDGFTALMETGIRGWVGRNRGDLLATCCGGVDANPDVVDGADGGKAFAGFHREGLDEVLALDE